MTDKEIMIHRFSKHNLRKTTAYLAKSLGMTKQEYEDAVTRGMKQEQRERIEIAARELERFAEERMYNEISCGHT